MTQIIYISTDSDIVRMFTSEVPLCRDIWYEHIDKCRAEATPLREAAVVAFGARTGYGHTLTRGKGASTVSIPTGHWYEWSSSPERKGCEVDVVKTFAEKYGLVEVDFLDLEM